MKKQDQFKTSGKATKPSKTKQCQFCKCKYTDDEWNPFCGMDCAIDAQKDYEDSVNTLLEEKAELRRLRRF